MQMISIDRHMGQQFHVRQSGDELYQTHRVRWELVPSSRQSRSSHANQASTDTLLSLCNIYLTACYQGSETHLTPHLKLHVHNSTTLEYQTKCVHSWRSILCKTNQRLRYEMLNSLLSPFFPSRQRVCLCSTSWSQTCPSPASSPTAPSSFASTSGDSHWKEKATLWQDLNEN